MLQISALNDVSFFPIRHTSLPISWTPTLVLGVEGLVDGVVPRDVDVAGVEGARGAGAHGHRHRVVHGQGPTCNRAFQVLTQGFFYGSRILYCTKKNCFSIQLRACSAGGGEAEPSEGCSYLPRVPLEKG